MAKKAVPGDDPSLPFTEIELRGTTYKLCFTFRALAKAGAWLRSQGITVNLLAALPSVDAHNVTALFAAGLHAFQPQMSYAQAEALVDYDTAWVIQAKVFDGWVQAMPAAMKGEKNPPEAAPETESGPSPNTSNGAD